MPGINKKLTSLQVGNMSQNDIIIQLNSLNNLLEKTPPENVELYKIIVNNHCLLCRQSVILSNKVLEDKSKEDRERELINKAFEKQERPKRNPARGFRMTSLYINSELI